MDQLPAVRALWRGCAELKLPHYAAVELVRFLGVVRSVGFRPIGMGQLSPSEDLDRLWHWMLLNTMVAKQVHEYIGGEVPHSTLGSCDKEEDKVNRQLRAMTLMAREGYEPQMGLWRSEATVMRGTRRVGVTVDGVANACTIYVCDGVTTESHVKMLLSSMRYSDVVVRVKRVGDDDGDIGVEVVQCTERVADVTAKWIKDIDLTVKTLTNKKIEININNGLLVSDLKSAIATKDGTPSEMQLLIANGDVMLNDVPLHCYLDNGGEVVMSLKLSGC
jgi:Ubiquitin family